MYMFPEDLLDDFFWAPQNARPVREPSQEWSQMRMKTDILQIGEDIQLRVELPGYARNQVKLHLKDGYLTIEASREDSASGPQQGRYLRRERGTGRCSRTFYVGKDHREEDFKARYEAGILIITFPKEVKRAAEEKKYITIEG